MFDNVCKFLAETFPADFAQRLLEEALLDFAPLDDLMKGLQAYQPHQEA